MRPFRLFAFALLIAGCADSGPQLMEITPTSSSLTRQYGDVTRMDEVVPRPEGMAVARFISSCNESADAWGYQRAYVDNLRCLRLMDAALEFHVADGLPYYRAWLVPRDLADRSILNALPDYFALVAHKAPGGPQRFVAKLPADRSYDNEWGISTGWTLCLSCVGYSADGTPDPAKADHLANALAYASRPSDYDPTIGIEFMSAPGVDLVQGEDALLRVEQIAGVTVPRLRDYAEAEGEYDDFIAEYERNSFTGQLKRECGGITGKPGFGFFSDRGGLKSSGEVIQDSIDGIEDIKLSRERFDKCATDFIVGLNEDERANELAAFVEKERRLAEESGNLNSEKRVDLSIDAELATMRKYIDRQQRESRADIDDYLADIESSEDVLAYKEYERTRPKVNYGALLANASANFNRDIAKMNRDTARVAETAQARARAEERARERSKAKALADAEAVASVEPSGADTQAAGSADPAPGAQAADGQATAEDSTVPVDTLAPTQVAVASPAIPEDETPREELTRLSGGMFACVGVVETKRLPGSSPLSSCSYETPDREALIITFVNRCGVPVNIEMDVAYDTGESRPSSESNLRPGSQRETVGYCGATNYTYSFEETLDSLSKRGG